MICYLSVCLSACMSAGLWRVVNVVVFQKGKSAKISQINSVFNKRVIAEFLKSNKQSQVCFSKKSRETLIASPFMKREKKNQIVMQRGSCRGSSCSSCEAPELLRFTGCSFSITSRAWMLAKSLNLFFML